MFKEKIKGDVAFLCVCVCVCVCVLVTHSCPTLCNPMDSSCQAPLSMQFSRQEYWSGLPFPIPLALIRHYKIYLIGQQSLLLLSIFFSSYYTNNSKSTLLWLSKSKPIKLSFHQKTHHDNCLPSLYNTHDRKVLK